MWHVVSADGHPVGGNFLFFVGIIFPILWVVGALLSPTESAQAAGVR